MFSISPASLAVRLLVATSSLSGLMVASTTTFPPVPSHIQGGRGYLFGYYRLRSIEKGFETLRPYQGYAGQATSR